MPGSGLRPDPGIPAGGDRMQGSGRRP